MAARKLSISIPDDVAEASLSAAREAGVGLSAWVTHALRQHLEERVRWAEGRRAAEELVAASEALHGPVTAEELAWVDAAMAASGLAQGPGAVTDRAAS